MKTDSSDTIANVATALYYFLMCWILLQAITSADAPASMWLWHNVSRLCYKVSERFGSMGLRAETRYWDAAGKARG